MNQNDVNDYKMGRGTLGLFPITTDAAEAGSNRTLIVASAHSVKAGDIILFMDGPNCGKQIAVASIDTNSIFLAAPATVVPAVGAVFMALRFGLVVKDFKNIAASQTDAALVAAVAGKFIRLLYLVALTAGTATTFTFNTKPAGAGSAISCAFAAGANGGLILPRTDDGWCDTAVSGGLAVTTSAGSTTGFQFGYALL